MTLLRNSVRGALVTAALVLALAPNAVFADDRHAVPISGTFTVAFVILSAIPSCPNAGTFTMTGGNGDTLRGTDAGARIGSPNANGFAQFLGTLRVTRGTGRYSHARGVLQFSAITSPFSAAATPPTSTGTAFYLVQGALIAPDRD